MHTHTQEAKEKAMKVAAEEQVEAEKAQRAAKLAARKEEDARMREEKKKKAAEAVAAAIEARAMEAARLAAVAAVAAEAEEEEKQANAHAAQLPLASRTTERADVDDSAGEADWDAAVTDAAGILELLKPIKPSYSES